MLGPNVAKYSGKHLHDLVFESKYYKEGDIKEALRSSFLGIDEKLRQGNEHSLSGMHETLYSFTLQKTPNFSMKHPGVQQWLVYLARTIFFMWYVQKDMVLSPWVGVMYWKHAMAEKGKSNAGDSRAIICTRGRAIALSQDHKPGNEKETARIEKAGGHVEFGRVNGKLNHTRVKVWLIHFLSFKAILHCHVHWVISSSRRTRVFLLKSRL